MGSKALRVAERLARGSEEEWTRLSVALLVEIGCKCLFQPVVRRFFASFLQRLLNAATVHFEKLSAMLRRADKKHCDDLCRLRREQKKRREAVLRAACAEALHVQQRNLIPACVVCFRSERLLVLTPCGHVCVCEDCAHDLEVCPMCRAGVEQIYRVYT